MASAAEILAIADLARRCAADGTRAVLAQLVSVDGSHYRKPGARMLIAEDGRTAGAISAGCLETDLRANLPSVASEGRARVVEYDSRSFEDLVWGLGSGCNGLVRVLLAPMAPRLLSAIECARDALAAGASVRLATVVGAPPGSAARLGEMRVLAPDETGKEDSGVEAVVEQIPPPIGLLIAGCGPDAVPLARLAAELGWTVSVISARDAAFVQARFSGLPVVHAGAVAAAATVPVHSRTAAVVMSHNFVDDAAALEALLPRRLPYLGVLGPRERTRRLFAACGAAEDAASRIHSPVGFNIGAETAPEIALSIASEIQAVLAGASVRTGTVPGLRS